MPSTPVIWLSLTILLLLFVIWLLTRHQECKFSGEPEGSITDHARTIAGLTHGALTEGNVVELIQGPAFFERICDDIKQAKRSVHLETFLWEKGKAADLVADALCDAGSRGLRVRILFDARGSSKLGSDIKDRLRKAGCDIHAFHRWKLMNLGRFNIRDHRKLLVIDGQIAYAGGHCITDKWLEDQEDMPVYKDVTARFTGPVVNSLQSVFGENWMESGSDLFVEPEAFPACEGKGDSIAHVASLRADGCPSSVQVLHYLAISMAKTSIRIQNPYFLPDPAGAKALARAARRGVDVRIMAPATQASDSSFVTHAGHTLFRLLLEAGVRIFEYQPTLLHQKIITVDKEWCGIGSCNFDDRSFKINDEIIVGVFDPDVVAKLDEIFDRDAADCEDIKLEEWKQRSIYKRFRERLFYLFNEQF